MLTPGGGGVPQVMKHHPLKGGAKAGKEQHSIYYPEDNVTEVRCASSSRLEPPRPSSTTLLRLDRPHV